MNQESTGAPGKSGHELDVLDIDQLRTLGVKPHWFGLGFVQIKLDHERRLHFWHPLHGAITPEEELHDHRYDFHSTVRLGCIEHEVWSWNADDTGGHEMVEVSCQPGADTTPRTLGRGTVVMAGSYTLASGSHYSFPAHGFHRGRAPRGAVTELVRGPVVKDYARVIRTLDAVAVCPFSAPRSEDQCWEMVADLLGSQGLAG